MKLLDFIELKSEEIDGYLDLCLGKYEDKYYVYFDSHDIEVEESEIMISTISYSQDILVFNKTLRSM